MEDLGSEILHSIESASIDDFLGRSQPDHKKDQEEHEEQAGQELGDRKRSAGDRRKAEQRRENTNYEKYQGHVQHGFNPPLAATAKRVPKAPQ
jgi:hypothetical protein